jgi:TonB family protein
MKTRTRFLPARPLSACALVCAVLAAASPLAAQGPSLPGSWHVVMMAADSTTVSIDSATVRRSGDSVFVVRTGVRPPRAMRLASGHTGNQEVTLEELDCGAGRSRRLGYWLYLDATVVTADSAAGEWIPAAGRARRLFDASCAWLRAAFAGGPPVYRMADVDEFPELVNRSEVARLMSNELPKEVRAGGSGEVSVRFRIRTDGTVDPESMQVVSSSRAELEEPARRVARAMRFRPARANGEAVSVWITFPLVFRL